MKQIWVTSAVIVLAWVAAPLHAQLTYERLLKADSEPNNWLTYSGSYKGWLQVQRKGNVETVEVEIVAAPASSP